MNKAEKSYNLAVIGWSGSGKTTLAVALSQWTQSTAEGAAHVTCDSGTKEFIRTDLEALENGKKLHSTDGAPSAFSLTMLRENKGKTIIRFCDYKGGEIEKGHFREMIDDPDGALFLLNPVEVMGPDYVPLERKETFEKIVKYLKECTKCRCLTVVTVANDYYQSLPDGDKKKFDAIRSEFLAILRSNFNEINGGRSSGEHFVSINESNRVADKGANSVTLGHGPDNTTGKPFVWVLEQLEKTESAAQEAEENTPPPPPSQVENIKKLAVEQYNKIFDKKWKAVAFAAAVVLAALLFFWPSGEGGPGPVVPHPPSPIEQIIKDAKNIRECIAESDVLLDILQRMRTLEKSSPLSGDATTCRKDLLARLRDEFDGKAKERPNRRPDSIEDLEKFKCLEQDAYLSAEDYSAWKKLLDEKLDVKGWEERQNKFCVDFLDAPRDNAVDLVNRYRALSSEHPNAPKLRECAALVDKLAGEEFIEIRTKMFSLATSCPCPDENLAKGGLSDELMKANMETWRAIRELAMALNKVKCPILQPFPWRDFARKCVEQGNINGKLEDAFVCKLEINKIEAKLDYEDLPTWFKGVRLHELLMVVIIKEGNSGQWGVAEEAEEGGATIISQNGDWTEVWSGSLKCKGSPWIWAGPKIVVKEMNGNGIDKYGWRFLPLNVSDNQKGYSEMTIGIQERAGSGRRPQILCRVYWKSTGPNIFEFADEAATRAQKEGSIE